MNKHTIQLMIVSSTLLGVPALADSHDVTAEVAHRTSAEKHVCKTRLRLEDGKEETACRRELGGGATETVKLTANRFGESQVRVQARTEVTAPGLEPSWARQEVVALYGEKAAMEISERAPDGRLLESRSLEVVVRKE